MKTHDNIAQQRAISFVHSVATPLIPPAAVGRMMFALLMRALRARPRSRSRDWRRCRGRRPCFVACALPACGCGRAHGVSHALRLTGNNTLELQFLFTTNFTKTLWKVFLHLGTYRYTEEPTLQPRLAVDWA